MRAGTIVRGAGAKGRTAAGVTADMAAASHKGGHCRAGCCHRAEVPVEREQIPRVDQHVACKRLAIRSGAVRFLNCAAAVSA